MLPEPISRRSLDQLEEELMTLAQRINTAEFEFLMTLHEFDIRQGWKTWGCTDCVDWLDFRCRLCPNTAREKVRTARALYNLPRIAAAFAAGELSYSNVRALTRVASDANEARLLEYAMTATASQVERRCREERNGQRAPSTSDAERTHSNRTLSRSVNADGTMTIHAELPLETGELVMNVLTGEIAPPRVSAETRPTGVREERGIYLVGGL